MFCGVILVEVNIYVGNDVVWVVCGDICLGDEIGKVVGVIVVVCVVCVENLCVIVKLLDRSCCVVVFVGIMVVYYYCCLCIVVKLLMNVV